MDYFLLMQIRDNGQYIKAFGQRIREARLNKNMSQEVLAEQANVHRTYIGMIERGEKNVTLSTIINLSHSLDIKLEDLFKAI